MNSYSFTVTIEGRGSIESSRDLIASGESELQGQGPSRILVTFRALSAAESVFLGWSGDIEPWDGRGSQILTPELVVLMDRNRQITARFALSENLMRASTYAVDLAARFKERESRASRGADTSWARPE